MPAIRGHGPLLKRNSVPCGSRMNPLLHRLASSAFAGKT